MAVILPEGLFAMGISLTAPVYGQSMLVTSAVLSVIILLIPFLSGNDQVALPGC